ncbi:MAG: cyclic nucleotide-binding domain-containing protein [Actinomycetota bacterium]
MSSKDAASLLKKVPLFSGCTKHELDAIALATKEIHHREGHVIAREGDTGLGFFLITDGTADVSIGGKSRATLATGDFFGEISLLDRGPRTATVTASSSVTMLALTAWVFRGLVEQHPTIALNMLKVVAQRLRNAAKSENA